MLSSWKCNFDRMGKVRIVSFLLKFKKYIRIKVTLIHAIKPFHKNQASFTPKVAILNI